MQEHVPCAQNPSSKQIANHIDRKYALCNKTAAAESVPGLFLSVSTHFKRENSYFAAVSSHTNRTRWLPFMSQNTVFLSLGKRKTKSNINLVNIMISLLLQNNFSLSSFFLVQTRSDAKTLTLN